MSFEPTGTDNSYIKPDDELYARLITRKISAVFTRLIIMTPLTANQITLFDIFLGLLAAILFTNGNYYQSIIAALVLQLWYVFDCVDGEVARLKSQSSIKGLYLDYIGHDLVQPAVFIGIGFGVFNSKDQIFMTILNGNLWLLFLAFMAAYFSQLLYNPKSNIIRTAMSMLSSKMQDKYSLTISTVKHGEDQVNNKKSGRLTLIGRIKILYSKMSFIFTYPFIMNLLFFAAIFKLLVYVIVFYGVALPILWLFSVKSGYKYDYDDGERLIFYNE